MVSAARAIPVARPIRLGMVGGGQGAFIGAVHRIAARLDGEFALVAGAFSSDAERSAASGAEIGIDPARAYATFQAMAEAEARREDGIEAVAIVTPNHLHFSPAKMFLEAGIHVICEKPLTAKIEDAVELQRIAAASGRVFVLTHNYTGYPMIRQARDMIATGDLGPLRVVQTEYAQDWLTEAAESAGSKQAEWRVDPDKAGMGGALGDIGSHAFNLLTFVTGLELDSVAADLSAFVPGRRLDDNDHLMLRFKSGAKGMLWASQVAPGHENGLRLRVYGEKGGLEWAQENPNQLWFTPFGEPKRLITRGGSTAVSAAQRVTRVPAGHPEGYLEGFATIYREAAAAIRAVADGRPIPPEVMFPTVEDGVDAMRFIDAAVRSSSDDSRWTKLR
ncbi:MULTISPECIES: Gfo/Idh/MocA family protein [unclassified Aurantimonas]|uniref:Gfo/Idh/MocA family protein n=1 Tax=unclassified Aurantimonas TaxID=2638230 RepID=UPI002E170A72|nr:MULTISPECIES: Gfo/Idh/MocA family oxidoreductase [unclassified Aurantimonas]MEC5290557.1 Gfo/Idh/MocA family oxidoreductase [Aurantimonas sp. C2-3-R2]MEC5411480.1 Gfo/Idh/MocA family oxidoreductase [Aurantimonas sp. C2-4-R8]